MLLLRSVCNEQRKQMIRLCRTQLRGRSVGRHRRARVDDFYRIYFCKTQLFSSLQVIISIGVYMYVVARLSCPSGIIKFFAASQLKSDNNK